MSRRSIILKRLLAAAGALALLAAASLPTSAQTYPNRAVQLIVGYAAGGTGDVVARILSGRLAAVLGQSVVVENRAGGTGTIAAQAVIRSPPDGHMLLVGQTGEVAINQHKAGGAGYDPDTELQPIALAAVVPLALSVPAKAPYASVDELLAAARESKDGLTFASAGPGTPGHFAGELLRQKAGGKLLHVPYKGAGPALNDLIGGHVDFYFSGFPAVMPHMNAGTLKVLALSSGKPSAFAPNLPTVRDLTGIADFDLTLWVGFFAPRATSNEIIRRLNTEINAILNEPDVNGKLSAAGADVTIMSVADFTGFVKSESAKYLRIIKATGVTPE
jgi:tripartite-type tricarboxylate transporter receptor subunit TctC